MKATTDAAEFAHTVLAEAPDGSVVSFCSAQHGAFRVDGFVAADPELWMKEAEGRGIFAPGRDRYQSICPLHPSAADSPGRGSADDALGLTVLWLDLDFVDPAAHHRNGDLPDFTDAADAMQFMAREYALPPTLVTNTGHGLHALWRLAEFVPADEGSLLLESWRHHWLTKAKQSGRHLDDVFDLARVLRIPGTKNTKVSEDVRQAIIVEHDDETRVYQATDLLEWLVPLPDVLPTTPAGPGGHGRPGDDFNEQTDLVELLKGLGYHSPRSGRWSQSGRHRGKARDVVHLTRAGKADGTSATVLIAEQRVLSWSTSVPLLPPGRILDAFGVYAHWHHGADFAAAAAALAAEGYGGEDEDEDEGDAAKYAGPDGKHYTDLGNSERLVARLGDQLRFVGKWKQWLVWGGGVWCPDPSGARSIEAAKVVPADLWAQVAGMPVGAKGRKRLKAHANASESTARLKALVEQARGVPGVMIEHDVLDADPWLLNVANGVVDLRTGELRPASPADLCTMQLSVPYERGAACPTWLAFLARVLPDPDVRSHLQRAIGYALSGSVREQVMFIFTGGGANGKSTLIGAVTFVLGPYAVVADRALMMGASAEPHPTNVAALFRKRFAAAVETNKHHRLDEARVKQLTGGDRITARRMREDFWEFAPTHKLFLACNDLPVVSGTDDAIWRRLRVIPFTVTIPPGERDGSLPSKLAAEATGILSWAVEGCQQWLAEGLAEPTAVTAASTAYRVSQDVLRRFAADRLVFDRNREMPASTLRFELDRWCSEQEERKPNPHDVAAFLREHGCEDRRSTGGRKVWRGAYATDDLGGTLTVVAHAAEPF